MTAVLFAVIVIAWGFSWFAIHLQIGTVPPEISIFWRFALSAVLMWLLLAVTGRLRRLDLRQHGWFALMGASLFGLNFVLIYSATQHIASGIVSVVFTMATIFNAFNQWALLKIAPKPRTLAGAAFGIVGIALLFADQIAGLGRDHGAALGIALAAAGTYVFSLGNLASVGAVKAGADLPNAVARGMTWGTLFLGIYGLARGHGFPIALTPTYLGSLVYLAVVASVIGFLAYLSLVARVGADRAAYSTVLFPLIALVVSTFLESYAWTLHALVGLALILIGNVVIFVRTPSRTAAPPPMGKTRRA
ncbi:DMT family transporter [Segnochrobactrum spirostomi]|nr:DMT family transporter [Segnochrobactrum spirostomi]